VGREGGYAGAPQGCWESTMIDGGVEVSSQTRKPSWQESRLAERVGEGVGGADESTN